MPPQPRQFPRTATKIAGVEKQTGPRRQLRPGRLPFPRSAGMRSRLGAGKGNRGISDHNLLPYNVLRSWRRPRAHPKGRAVCRPSRRRSKRTARWGNTGRNWLYDTWVSCHKGGRLVWGANRVRLLIVPGAKLLHLSRVLYRLLYTASHAAVGLRRSLAGVQVCLQACPSVGRARQLRVAR